jgi:acetyl esterase/lipase
MDRLADADPMVSRQLLDLCTRCYVGDGDPRAPLASPLFADLAGLPPLLVHVGTAETLLDDARRFDAAAREAGVDVTLEEWDHMIHVWHTFAGLLPEAQQAIDRIGAFVQSRLA